MAQVLMQVLGLLTPPPPPIITEDFDGFQLRWKFFAFRPSMFKLEGALLGVIFLYFLFHLMGRYVNTRRAEKWYFKSPFI